MVRPDVYRKRNVWFLEMGPKESKIKSPPRTPARSNHGGRTRSVTGGHNMPMKAVQSSNPEPVPVWPDNSVRWQSLYDVYICHSKEEADCLYAMEMLSYLEQQPEKLRCFLPMRDMAAGSPIPSEMCSGLENSHCWVMVLTPHFLADSWCRYQMHQFLSQAPCSNGRLIPVVIGMTFAQYPSEVKHMYAFKGTLSDKSVFCKVKEAILTYLKEMLTVTSDQIPSHSLKSRTPESSQSTSMAGGNSQVESSVTQESIHDRSINCSVIQEISSEMSIRSSLTQEFTTNMCSRCPPTQEENSEKFLTIPGTHEMTTNMYSRSPMIQETTSEVSLKNLVSVIEETIGDMTSRNTLTQETTSEVSVRTLLSEETTSDMSLRSSVNGLETMSDMSMRSSVARQETTSDISMVSSVVGQGTTSDLSMSSMTGQESNSDLSMSTSVTGQETSSDMSMSSVTIQKTTPDWLQDKYKALSLSPQLINTRDVCKDCKCIMTATKYSFSQETEIDSGIWSMTKDLHTDCSDLHTYGVETANKDSHSDCSDYYPSPIGELPGQKDSHPQAVSIDSDALHNSIYTRVSGQSSATCPQEHQCFPNR